jgi:Phage P22-like portal protein
MAQNKYQTTDPFLKDCLDRFDYFKDRWHDIREASKEDMRYVSGDPWDPKEKRARQAVNRPCLVMDELGQYVNAPINEVRQNPRAVQVIPEGSGANDKTANHRANIIRGIEYRSEAQQAYITGFENAIQRSYGYWRINTQFVADSSFDQEIVIRRIPNPDTVYLDPDCKHADCSDGKDAFVIDLKPKREFQKRWPKAKMVDFTIDIQEALPSWIKEDEIQVAEYWKSEEKERKLLLVDGGRTGPLAMFEDELPTGFSGKIMKDRLVRVPKITQYITNGVEILEEHEWAGKFIPLVPVFGKELWVDDGSGSKRVLLSLIRLARDPYMLYCYYRTTEAEIISMTPKTPYIGVEGQFTEHEKEWQQANTTPLAYLQYKAKTNATGETVLPPPARPAYSPQIEPMEMGAESARRSIMTATGISPLPTAAQRVNEKSGVAIERIQSQANQGTYHFLDNYDRALMYSGRIIDDLIDKIYDTERQVPIRKMNEEHSLLTVNDPKDADTNLSTGKHGITISVGPEYESQREQASSFVDLIVQNIETLPIDPPAKAKLLALSVKLKNIGPIGDEISDLLAPPQTEAQMQQKLQLITAQAAQYQQMVAQLQAENQILHAEKNGKVVDNEYMLKKATLDNDVKVLIAQIQTKAQDALQRAQMYQEFMIENHGAAHEAAMQAVQHSHDKQLAQDAQAHQSALAAQSSESSNNGASSGATQ